MTGTTLPSVDFCVYNESKRKHALSELSNALHFG